MDVGTKFGRCHICREERDVTYCPLCDHWFCVKCRHKWWSRGLAAVKELVGEKKPGCCGPTGEEVK